MNDAPERSWIYEIRAERDAEIAKRDEWRAEYKVLRKLHELFADKNRSLIAERDALRAEVERLRATVAFFEGFGCPLCGGDCSAANPPVTFCPMQEARAALGDSKP